MACIISSFVSLVDVKDRERKYLSAECQLIAQSRHIILQQVDQTLEERVVLTLHVCVPDDTTHTLNQLLHGDTPQLTHISTYVHLHDLNTVCPHVWNWKWNVK